MMSTEQDRRSVLMDQASQLRERIGRIHLHHARNEPLEADFAEAVDERANLPVLDELEGALGERLSQIDHALHRIEAGVGDCCEVCGQPIGIQRLRAMPDATRCVACAAH
jgi:DnaK suppressor protein